MISIKLYFDKLLLYFHSAMDSTLSVVPLMVKFAQTHFSLSAKEVGKDSSLKLILRITLKWFRSTGRPSCLPRVCLPFPTLPWFVLVCIALFPHRSSLKGWLRQKYLQLSLFWHSISTHSYANQGILSSPCPLLRNFSGSLSLTVHPSFFNLIHSHQVQTS